MNDILITIIERLNTLESLIKRNLVKTDKLMTIKDVAEYSSLSDMSVYRAVQRGSLKVFKDKGKKLFRKTDVDSWLVK
tara:strand:- start:1106 stop:1339 length:234 start_codon:yes stop_codon:yes gene_type:complete